VGGEGGSGVVKGGGGGKGGEMTQALYEKNNKGEKETLSKKIGLELWFSHTQNSHRTAECTQNILQDRSHVSPQNKQI
jgi:hypothetical protein